MEGERSLETYLKRLGSLHCAKINGRRVLAKPMFILAIINAIDDKKIVTNRFYWNPQEEQYNILNKYYKECFGGYAPNSYITPLHKPFFHLNYEGFWHLKINDSVKLPSSSSSGFLKTNLEYAYFDDAFWNLLQGQNNREVIRDYIVEKYIKSS